LIVKGRRASLKPQVPVRAAMRVLVTGATNPVGAAIVRAMAGAGHEVRAFGIEPGTNPFEGNAAVECFPGLVEIGGSVEPALSEVGAVVHAACLDAPGKDAHAHAVHLERGTLYARYGAERELVDRFIVLLPAQPDKAWRKALAAAEAHAKATKPIVSCSILRVLPGAADATASEVVRLLTASPRVPQMGAIH
jgi:hypothetical protein